MNLKMPWTDRVDKFVNFVRSEDRDVPSDRRWVSVVDFVLVADDSEGGFEEGCDGGVVCIDIGILGLV
jgi:hypothetical protein